MQIGSPTPKIISSSEISSDRTEIKLDSNVLILMLDIV